MLGWIKGREFVPRRSSVWEMSRKQCGQRGIILGWGLPCLSPLCQPVGSLQSHPALPQGGRATWGSGPGRSASPGLLSCLCHHLHLHKVGTDSGELLPVSAGLVLGRHISVLWRLELLGPGQEGVYLALPCIIQYRALKVGPNVFCCSSQFNTSTIKLQASLYWTIILFEMSA